MKKLFYGAALLVVAAGSFAFLPKENAVQHALLVSAYIQTSYGTSSPEVYLVMSNDAQNVEVLKSKLPAYIEARQAALKKLDEMVAAGWVITSTYAYSSGSANGRIESSIVLTKR